MNSRSFVEKSYVKFCELEGNEYIASEFVIYNIIKMIQRFDLRDLLELGVGIGTIADTVLNYENLDNLGINYVGTENNEFCRISIKNNVDRYSDLKLFKNLEDIPDSFKFDLIIIDGSGSLDLLKSACKDKCIILVEGDRMEQTKRVLSIFPKASYVHLTSLTRKKDYAPGKKNVYQSGARIIFLNPDLSRNLFIWEHKIKTYFNRYLRNYNTE